MGTRGRDPGRGTFVKAMAWQGYLIQGAEGATAPESLRHTGPRGLSTLWKAAAAIFARPTEGVSRTAAAGGQSSQVPVTEGAAKRGASSAA